MKRVIAEIQAIRSQEERPDIESSGPTYEGIDKDDELKHFPEHLKQAFTEDLLNSAFISRIVYRPDQVNVFFNGDDDYFLPVEVYRKWAKQNPEIRNQKVRAENFSNWVKTGFTQGIMPLPIHLFSFEGENTDDFPYLEELPQDKRMEAHKFGTVAHEIAHHLYNYFLKPEEQEEWVMLAGRAEPLTAYCEKYKTGAHSSDAGYAEEQFSEAVRLFTTVPKYLEEKNSEIYAWVHEKFPEIAPYTDTLTATKPL
jgi:hypothetical protein